MQFIYTLLTNTIFKRILFICILFFTSIALFLLVTKQPFNAFYALTPDELMKEIPFYTVIKKNDPQLYQRISDDIELALNEENGSENLRHKVRGYLDQIISKRVPTAANDAVIAYMKVTLKEMQALERQGYDLCYNFLYPMQGETIDISKYVQKSLLDQDMTALTDVVRSSYERPLPIPRGKDVQLYLSHVYTILEQNHGPDVDVLANPLAKNINKNKVCTMTIAFFEEILRLPTKQSGETLRYIVLKNNSL